MNDQIRLLGVAALGFCLLAAVPARGEEYTGLASYNYSTGAAPRTFALQGGGFNITAYEDKAQTCPGGNTDLAGLRRGVVDAASDWVRVSYSDCKDGFALICVDADVNGKEPPKTCASVATKAPPTPDILATYSGTVSHWASDDADNQSLGFSGDVFGITLTPDPKNVCKGKDSFATFLKFIKTVGDDDKVRITYKDCTAQNALVCVDSGLAGTFSPKACSSFATNSGEQGD